MRGKRIQFYETLEHSTVKLLRGGFFACCMLLTAAAVTGIVNLHLFGSIPIGDAVIQLTKIAVFLIAMTVYCAVLLDYLLKTRA